MKVKITLPFTTPYYPEYLLNQIVEIDELRAKELISRGLAQIVEEDSVQPIEEEANPKSKKLKE